MSKLNLLSFSFSTNNLPKPVKVSNVMRFINGLLKPFIGEKILIDLSIALEELTTNILKHSYSEKDEAEINFFFTVDENQVKIIIEDKGKKGKQFKIATNDKSPSDEEIVENFQKHYKGIGVYLVKKIMDNISYDVTKKCNRLTLIKKI
jgi:serine/threonine-protein kinase RsbW